MAHAFKKIQVSANARPGRPARDGRKGKYAASLSLADLWPATAPAFVADEPPAAARYLIVRQLNGKNRRIDVASLRLNIYRPRRIERPVVLAMAA